MVKNLLLILHSREYGLAGPLEKRPIFSSRIWFYGKGSTLMVAGPLEKRPIFSPVFGSTSKVVHCWMCDRCIPAYGEPTLIYKWKRIKCQANYSTKFHCENQRIFL